jgi:dethiobiotin synthetase
MKTYNIEDQAKGVFVAGTDTGVGKTTFTRGFLRALSRKNCAPVPYKPVETGFLDPLRSDANALRLASRSNLELAQICPFPFLEPLAPVVAAQLLGISLSVDALCNARPSQHGDPLVIESAGGLLTPISRKETNADIAAAFAFPIILVARNSLGTINHCALAITEIQRRRLPLAALVLVDVSPRALDGSTNAACIADLTGVAAETILPFDPTATDDQLAEHLESVPHMAAILESLSNSR